MTWLRIGGKIITGFYYLKTRYYDPELGRFISQDSIEYADPETINGLNLFAYCANNPVMFTDPNGTSFLLALLIGSIAGAVIGATANGVSAYKEGRRGIELFASIAGGAIFGGAMGAVMVLGGAAGLAATGVTITGFGISAGVALGISLGIGAIANTASYLLINGLHKDKNISFGGIASAFMSGALQAGLTFGTGYLGGKNGLFNKLGNFNTMDGFYKHIISLTGKINPLSALFYGTSILIGDTLTKALYLSSLAAGSRALIKRLFKIFPD